MRSVGVCGVGLMGGSIGLAILARGLPLLRIGLDRHAPTRRLALRRRAVDVCLARAGRRLRDCHLVILCVPGNQVRMVLERIAPHLPPGCVVTDVTPNKLAVKRQARRTLPRRCHFVGSHPLAGSGRKGVAHAQADLLDGGRCLVTRTSATDAEAVRLVQRFWTALGMRVTTLTPKEHDLRMARRSGK